MPARAAQPLARFRELIEGLREEARRLSVKPLLERTLALSGYAAALAQEDTQESQDRLENLAELLSAAADYESRDDNPTLARLPRPRLAAVGAGRRERVERRCC